ncbi:MAG: hypothetical protein E4H17_03985 [Gemmatimonadales bacterium]|nr:MAG: hypothetical protein E4H17_03985 [Gemmatimonadales bacterium]
MPIHALTEYRYRGARALVLLHDQALRELLPVWRRAKAADLSLPETTDPDYASMETLLHHVLRSARGYLTWLCEKLGLPDPGIDPAPDPPRVAYEAGRWVEHLLDRWRLPLVGIEEGRFNETFVTRWGVDMSCESMLEHAVLHPIRHRFQLEELREEAP